MSPPLFIHYKHYSKASSSQCTLTCPIEASIPSITQVIIPKSKGPALAHQLRDRQRKCNVPKSMHVAPDAPRLKTQNRKPQ